MPPVAVSVGQQLSSALNAPIIEPAGAQVLGLLAISWGAVGLYRRLSPGIQLQMTGQILDLIEALIDNLRKEGFHTVHVPTVGCNTFAELQTKYQQYVHDLLHIILSELIFSQVQV